MEPTNSVRPFANGSQFGDWEESNCARCTKYSDDAKKCPIHYAIMLAFFGDGEITEDIARRMGYFDHPGSYVWMCNEVEWAQWWKDEMMRREAGQE